MKRKRRGNYLTDLHVLKSWIRKLGSIHRLIEHSEENIVSVRRQFAIHWSGKMKFDRDVLTSQILCKIELKGLWILRSQNSKQSFTNRLIHIVVQSLRFHPAWSSLKLLNLPLNMRLRALKGLGVGTGDLEFGMDLGRCYCMEKEQRLIKMIQHY